MRERTRLALAAVLVGLALAADASADVAPRWSDQQLVEFSRVIVSGRVAGVAAAYDDSGAIYTFVTIDVSEVLKGFVPESRIVLKQLGGGVGDTILMVAGQPTFVTGEDVVVFLERRPRDGTLYTTALWQGKWTVRSSAAGTPIAQQIIPDPIGPSIVAGVRAAAPFIAQVRALSGEASRRPSGLTIDTAPVEAPIGGATHEAFTLLGPARWPIPSTGGSVPVVVQMGGYNRLPGGGLAQIATGRGLINGAGSALTLTDGGSNRPPRCRNPSQGNPDIWISFGDPCGEIDNDGGTLAIGGFFASGPIQNVSGIDFFTIDEGFVVNNDNANTLAVLDNARCFQDVQTHEILHAVGLGHTNDPNAIMFPTIDNACFNAISAPASSGVHFDAITGALGADDIAGLLTIYPTNGGPAPGPPGKPTANLSAQGNTLVASWAAGPGGAPTSFQVVVEMGAQQGPRIPIFNQNVGLATGGQGVVPDGQYFMRVTAINNAGQATSDEASVTVGMPGPGPCTQPPPTPGNLMVVKTGNNGVTVTWSQSPGATSYRVQADLNGVPNVFDVDIGNFTGAVGGPGLPNGTYTVRIFAVNACGQSTTPAVENFTLP